MRTEPAIPLKQIRQYINEYYHTHIDTLEFLPIGEGAWCFHGKGDLDLFIRLVKDPPAKETLYLSQFLHDQGLPVVSVLPDKSGEFISNIGKGGIIVYPFIHGTSLMKSSVLETDVSHFRKKIGTIIARLHRLNLGDNVRLHLPTEDFSKFQAESVAILQIVKQEHHDPLLKDFSHFLCLWQKELENLLRVTRKLARHLRSHKLDYVLCHGDIHEDNVLVSREGQLFIIDWDNMILAPRERDLMFFYGTGLVDYLEGYRRHEVNYQIHQTLVDYYVLEWALQEIVDYGTRLSDTRFDTSGRLDAWKQFQGLFEPGEDVDRAFGLMKALEECKL